MIWLSAFEKLSQRIQDPYLLEFTYRGLKGLDKLEWLNLMRKEISKEDYGILSNLTDRLAADEPPQYILSEAEFCGLKLKIDSRALIPRPETEELVSEILAENSAEAALQVLDLCTGSGAIALALKENRPNWQVIGSDISGEALDLAQENKDLLGLEVVFKNSDMLSNLTGSYDLIVSNPPYISREDEREVETSVLRYEPHLALFAEQEGMSFYEQIAATAGDYLTEDGKIYLEIGYKEGSALRELFEKHFPRKRVRLLKDSNGRDRMLIIDQGEKWKTQKSFGV